MAFRALTDDEKREEYYDIETIRVVVEGYHLQVEITNEGRATVIELEEFPLDNWPEANAIEDPDESYDLAVKLSIDYIKNELKDCILMLAMEQSCWELRKIYIDL